MVSQPFGFQDSTTLDHVCLPRKSLYGLKQSPRCWFQRLREVLVGIGLKESHVDPSLFLYNKGQVTIHLAVYIDDIEIVGSDDIEASRLIKLLSKEFPIRDLGELKFFLGIHVNRVANGLHLSHTQHLVNLLQSYDMENLKSIVTPMVENLDLQLDEDPIEDTKKFRQIFGLLQYITLTCLDVLLIVNWFS